MGLLHFKETYLRIDCIKIFYVKHFLPCIYVHLTIWIFKMLTNAIRSTCWSLPRGIAYKKKKTYPVSPESDASTVYTFYLVYTLRTIVHPSHYIYNYDYYYICPSIDHLVNIKVICTAAKHIFVHGLIELFIVVSLQFCLNQY